MFVRALIIASSALAIAGTVHAQDTYRISGGPSGTAWHPAWSAAVQLLSKELSGKHTFQYSPSQGSVENVRRVRQGDAAAAWAHIPQIYESWSGTGMFEKDGANTDYRIVANVREQTQIMAVLADSPIRSYSDMKGKVVNLLAKGSGGNVNCENTFKALGLLDAIEPRYLGFSAGARALGDRQIDVYCSSGVPYQIPALTEISLRRPVRYVSLTPEEQQKLVTTHRFYSAVTIPVQKEVKGMDEPARTIGYDVWWIVNKKVPDQAVYDMLKTIADPENLKALTATAGYWSSLSGKFDAIKEHKIFVHPAAARYWRERGVTVPDDLVRGYNGAS